MERVEDLIRYSTENEEVDFKVQEFKKEQFAELIKDILAFSNANFNGNRYIIIGVKKVENEPVVYPIEQALDAANIQQLIHENIFPEVKISYDPFKFEGVNLMVLTIHNPVDQPYMVAKNYPVQNGKGLAKHEMWIRKGSFKLLISRHDLDKIYKDKFKPTGLDGKIDLTFLNGSHSLDVECIREIQLPSDYNKRQIEEQIQQKEELLRYNPTEYSSRYTSRWDPQQNYYSMDLPALRVALEGVKNKYQTDDNHYLNEQRAFKLNLLIHNFGEMHLEKTMVVLHFPDTPGLSILNKISPTIFQISIVTGGVHDNYPNVKNGKDETVVIQDLGEVRHQLPNKVFKMELRMVVVEELAGRTLSVRAEVFAANLTKTFETNLTFQFT